MVVMNRLSGSMSPYLQQQRQPGGLVALVRRGVRIGAARDVPILLSVGYAACHWCQEAGASQKMGLM